MCVKPDLNISQHTFLSQVVEQIVVMTIIKLQALIFCANLLIEMLATTW